VCDVISRAMSRAGELPESSRRRFLQGMGATAVAGGMLMAGTGTAKADSGGGGRNHPVANRTRLIMLGVGGGPAYTRSDVFGISTAVVYENRVYLVDAGLGSYRRLVQSGLAAQPTAPSSLTNVRGIFFTHLHSDHITDWPAMYVTGPSNRTGRPAGDRIAVRGPSRRDTLPRLFRPNLPEPELVNPGDPTPGIAGMTGYLRQAFASDFNDRARDGSGTAPDALFDVQDIDLSGIWEIDPDGRPPRLPRPIEVWQDGEVRITATLVDHHPTAPSFGFRFDTPDGSIVVSGDTTVSQNLIDLARNTDYLVHEVIDPVFVDEIVARTPPELREGLREHLLESHTTIEQVGRDVAEPARVRHLVLNHLVPNDPSPLRWAAAQNGYSGELTVGTDLLQLGVGR
jgi:ribonuclease BN (tRNA processing enzyme)